MGRRTVAGPVGRAELSRPDDAEFAERLRSQSGRGRPVGSDNFLSNVEKMPGRRGRPLAVGHPRKRTYGAHKLLAVPYWEETGGSQ